MSETPTTPAEAPTAARRSTAERLTLLEQKLDEKPKSMMGRVAATAALVGLFISMINGAFTIYDQTARKPDAERAAQYNAIKSNVRLILTINEDAMAKAMSSQGAANVGLMASANTKTQSIMQDTDRLLRLLGPAAGDRDGPYFIGTYDFGVLSQAAYSGGNLEKAIDYSARAVTAAENFHSMSNALRGQATLTFLVYGKKGMPEAQRHLQEALKVLEGRTDLGVAFDRAGVYATLAGLEAYSRRCRQSVDAARRALSIASAEDTFPGAQIGIRHTIFGSISGQERCKIQLYPSEIQALVPRPTSPPRQYILPPPPIIRLSLLCRFTSGPREGQTHSFEGVPGVQPAPVGTPCNDGAGSFGYAK